MPNNLLCFLLVFCLLRFLICEICKKSESRAFAKLNPLEISKFRRGVNLRILITAKFNPIKVFLLVMLRNQ